jgi:hypothetical protein
MRAHGHCSERLGDIGGDRRIATRFASFHRKILDAGVMRVFIEALP